MKFKYCLFGTTSIVRNSGKEKCEYSAYGITFDNVSSRSYDNHTSRNATISDVDNSSSFHADNHKDNFLVLEEGTTFGSNGRFGSPEKKV